MSYLRFEDQPNGLHVFFDDVTDPTHAINGETFNESDIATLNRSVPHTIKFAMDFLDGPDNDLVKIYIDNSLVKTGTSWEDYYRFDTESQGNPHDVTLENKSRTVDSLLFRTGGSTDNPGVAGEGFLIDNLSLLSGPIPSCKAAPAVANELLRQHLKKPKEATVQNYVSQVANHMGPQSDFDGVEVCNTAPYKSAVDSYLDSTLNAY
jgi:hypothetical protein